MPCMRRAVWLVVFCWTYCGLSAANTAPVGQLGLGLRRYDKPNGGRARWVYGCRISGSSTLIRAGKTELGGTFRLDSTCYREGERLDVTTVREDGGKPLRAWRSIVCDWYLSYEVPPPGKKALFGFYAEDGTTFAGAAFPSGWSVFEGYGVGDDLPLVRIIQGSPQVKVTEDTVDGRQCIRLVADSPDYGHYQLWFDPAVDYLPRKVIVEKNDRSYWGERRLEEWARLAPRGGHGTSAVRSITYTIEDTNFDRVEGRWFPVSCRLTRVDQHVDGSAQKIVLDCVRRRLELNPDFRSTHAFVPELREGATLANQVDPHLAYQWKGGRPVPLFDADVVGQMDRAAQLLKQDMSRASDSR